MPRAVLTLAHRYVGLAIAGFLIIAGLTGAPLAFYPELDAALNPDVLRVQPRDGPPLSPDLLIARLHDALPQAEVTGLNYESRGDASVRAYVQPRADPAADPPRDLDYDEVFIDPFDGRVLGMRGWGQAGLDRLLIMPFLYKLHYSLHIPSNVGILLFGIVALFWMFDCFVGFYLTLPARAKVLVIRQHASAKPQKQTGKTWWQRWKPAWRIKTRAGPVRLNFDIHRAAGLWFWLVMFVLAMTSVSLNLSTEVARPVVALFADFAEDPIETLPQRPAEDILPRISYATALAVAQSALPAENQESNLSYLSYLAGKRVYWLAFVAPDKANKALRLDYAHVFVDADTGHVAAIRTYADGASGDKFMDWQFPLHSGQILGLPGRILICISGLVVVALSITGVIIWWKKRVSRAAGKRRSRPSAVFRASKSAAAPRSDDQHSLSGR